MKKRVLSLLLVVAMLASLVVFPAYAADTDLCPCGCGETNIEWKTWTGTSDPASGHYKLTGDLITAHANIGNSKNLDAEIVLDLNGYTWRANEGDYLMSIGLVADAAIEMTIMDSVGGGELQATGVTGGYGVIRTNNNTELNICGGTIRQLYSADVVTALGALYAMNATVNMSGGKITDGYTTSTDAASAGNVLVRGTTVFTMTGGEITNGHATKYGGGVVVYSADSHFIMNGGKIYNNVTEGNGGNVYISTGSATFNAGAEIYNGVAGGYGNNIYMGGSMGTVTLNGVSKIDGDIYTNRDVKLVGTVNIPMGNSNGIMVYSGKTLDVTNMDDGSKVFYGAASGQVFTTGGGAAKSTCFYNVGRTAPATVGETELTGAAMGNSETLKSYCPHCGEDAEPVIWYRSSNASAKLGTYTHFFANNSTPMKAVFSETITDVVFDLNGVDQTKSSNTASTGTNATLRFTLAANSKLALLDTVGGGAIQGGSSSVEYGGLIGIASKTGSTANAKVDFYSGTFTGISQRGGTYVANGTVNVHGGIFKDCKSTSYNGAGICVNNAAGAVNISGGLFTGGTAASRGGNVYSVGALTITGGHFVNGQSNYNGGNISIFAAGTYSISNAVIRGGTTTVADSAYGVGGNIGLHMDNITLNIDNCTIAAGGTLSNGGNIGGGDMATNIYINNSVIYDGAVSSAEKDFGNGGNIYLNDAAELTLTNSMVFGGTASGSDDVSNSGNGGNIYVARATKFDLTNCNISDGYAAVAGGNVYLRNNNVFDAATFTDCVISNGSAGDLETDVAIRSDNVWTGVGVTLDNTKIYGTSGLNNIGSGLRLQNNGSTHKETVYVTLKGDTQIGTAEHPFDASLSIEYGLTGNPAGLVIDESFTGSAVLSPDGLSYTAEETTDDNDTPDDTSDDTVTTTYTSDFDPDDVYGKVLKSISCDELNGTLYLGDHKSAAVVDSETGEVTEPCQIWAYGMPQITLNADGELVVDEAGAIVNGKHYSDISEAVENYADGHVLKLTAEDPTLTLTDGTYYIDVNGKNVNVSGSAVVYGIDTKTDDHANAGTGTLVAAAGVTVKAAATNPVTGDVYVRTVDTDKYEFHHIDMDITSVVLRTSNAGVYYKGTWACDEELAGYIAEQNDNILYGVVASVDNMPENSFDKDTDDAGNSLNRWSYNSGAAFLETKVVSGALVTGIMKESNEASVNADNTSLPIYAKAYLMVTEDDGTESYIVGKTGANKSLMDMLVKIDSSLAAGTNDLTSQGDVTTLMNNFYNTWKDLGLQAAIDAQDHTFTEVCCTPAESDEGTEA